MEREQHYLPLSFNHDDWHSARIVYRVVPFTGRDFDTPKPRCWLSTFPMLWNLITPRILLHSKGPPSTGTILQMDCNPGHPQHSLWRRTLKSVSGNIFHRGEARPCGYHLITYCVDAECGRQMDAEGKSQISIPEGVARKEAKEQGF